MLDLVRPIVAKIDGTGHISRVEGGYGGFLGIHPSAFENTNVLDHLDDYEGERLANYFIQNADLSVDSITAPMPFRIDMLGRDGHAHPVDIIPTAYEEDGMPRGWIVVAVPIASTTAVSLALEAEMSGASRQQVRELLTRELATGQTGWLLVDLPEHGPITVTAPGHRFRPLADICRIEIEAGWRPWSDANSDPATLIDLDTVPEHVRNALGRLDFTRLAVAPVRANGAIIACYLHGAERTAYTGADTIKINALDRIQSLVDVTSLVLTRWNNRDDLTELALSDTLTGLSNRQAFSTALDESNEKSALLYLDVDSFKSVNDTLGHEAGDDVLCEIADRIVAACRPNDVVARLGGDEFAVLLHNVDMDTARTIGERIVEAVRNPMPIDGCDRITVSAGLARLAGGVDSVNDADQAMLHAKRTGRDQLVVA